MLSCHLYHGMIVLLVRNGYQSYQTDKYRFNTSSNVPYLLEFSGERIRKREEEEDEILDLRSNKKRPKFIQIKSYAVIKKQI